DASCRLSPFTVPGVRPFVVMWSVKQSESGERANGGATPFAGGADRRGPKLAIRLGRVRQRLETGGRIDLNGRPHHYWYRRPVLSGAGPGPQRAHRLYPRP